MTGVRALKHSVGKTLVLAAGGTGGHVFPAQALGEEMLAKGWKVELWTDRRGLRFVGGFPPDISIRRIPAATFGRGGGIERLTAPVQILLGIIFSCLRAIRLRPTVIAGFGGYPAFPPMVAAWLTGIPRLIHEQNGILGKANRLLAGRVDVIACGAVSTALPKGVVSVSTGNPVRAEVAAKAGSPYEWPSDGPVRILVIGGSQGARILDCYVPAAVSRLPVAVKSRVFVSQQAGSFQRAIVERYYEEAGVGCDIRPFFDDVPEQIAKAHIVVSRAGASAVAEIAAIGRPAILVPFAAAANNHQTANAAGLVGAGAAIQVEEREMSADLLAAKLQEIIENPDGPIRMAAAARNVAQPDATEKLAELVEKLADGSVKS